MPWTRRNWRGPVSTSALALLTGCALTTGIGGTDAARDGVAPTAAYCRLAEPIGWSRADTDATIRAVKAHNAVHAALCGNG